MKLGVLQFFSWPERRVDLATVYARALERIESMDRTGYDAVWLAEHHFSSFSVCPSVHMVGTLAAARTKRLRIGTAVSLAPFYHPLRLAEEVALLDLLSGGRVNWGAGRGLARVEFTAFGVPPEESVSRFHETVKIVLKAWTEAKLTFAGKHFHFEDVEVLPQTSAAAASADMGGGEFEGGDRLGGRPRLFDPDGPALVGPGDRRQAALLRRQTDRRRVLRGRPRHPDRPLGGDPADCRQSKGRRAQRRRMDRQLLSRHRASTGHAAQFLVG
jgi:Luciferase-like monooxygenase